MAFRKGNQHIEPSLDDAESDKKTQFFLAASHQLKAPVAIVQWCLQSALEDPHITAKTRNWISKALSQSNAMSQLITDMLYVFRLGAEEYGKKTYVPVSLNEVIEKVLEQYEPVAVRKQVHLIKGPIEKLPTIFANEAFVRQSLVNLVDNGIKYTDSGESVMVSARVHDGKIEIAVTDKGIGIAEADLHMVGKEFYRGTEARAVAHEGTGLGLVLAKSVMEQLGGDIQIESVLHKGTTFTMRIPLPSVSK